MDRSYRNTNIDNLDYTAVAESNKLLRASFSWMGLALLLTTLMAWLFATVPGMTALLMEPNAEGVPRPTVFAYACMFAPLIFVLVLGFRWQKMSYPALIGLFVAYALVNGVSFSTIFFAYKLGSIVKVFASTAALFGLMAIAGYTTKTDLTKLGSILMIGLIGIVIATLINIFTQSPGLDYLISILGVIIFTGLTAYDVQKIKNLGHATSGSGLTSRLGIMGALTLYLDFINLFFFLLRLFGDRKD